MGNPSEQVIGQMLKPCFVSPAASWLWLLSDVIDYGDIQVYIPPHARRLHVRFFQTYLTTEE